MIGTLLQHRYRLDAELGRGGMGVIYRAHDTRLDRAVAVKVLSDAGLGTEGRARLLREAQAAARLNDPNIVTVYDAGEAEPTAGAGPVVPFIVMELVEGRSLFESAPASLDETLAVARQICSALDHAHAHGIVHRDLKPENVLLTSNGAVKLTDFGLARSLASRLTTAGTVVGTVFYMAPEIALGRPADGRADLYALGVMLYEWLAGRLPFDADEPLAVISQHLYTPVVPPSTYAPSIPPALDALIVQLMSKAPEDRPASAADVLRALEQLDTAAPAAAMPRTDLSLLDRIARGKLIGRDRELAEAQARWQRALVGEGHVLLVSGEPGIGKTRLAREVIAQAQVAGAIVLSGECYAEGGAPYAPIAQAFRETVADPRYPIEKLNLPQAAVIDLLRLALDPRGQPAAHAADPQAERQRLFESVVAWIAALAARAPVLLFVDDVHWADDGTLALLRHLARRARRWRLLTLLTYREVELDEARPLNATLHALNRERLAARVKLARLSEEQTRDLIRAMLAEEVSAELADGIYRETEGNPFFVEEVVKALIEDHQLYREDGRWCCAALSDMEIPQSVRVTIQSRVARLAEPAQEALRMAAVLGREFDFDTLRQAAGADEDALIAALETAEHAQLISEVRRAGQGRPSSPTFSFAHALIPSTLREGVSGLRRQKLNWRAAAAIEALRPDDFEALAYHYGEAGDEARARTYLIRAGDRAKSLYANRNAITFYTEALALMAGDDPQRFDVLASRAAVYDLIAEREAQRADVDALWALAERLDDDARRCDALIAAADLALAAKLLHALEPARKAVALAGALNDPVREGRARQRLGWACHFRNEERQARIELEVAIARFREAGLLADAAACLNRLALVACFGLGERDAAQRAAEEAVALSRQADDRQQEAVSLRRLAMVYGAHKRYADEVALTQQALAIDRELGNRSEEHNALYNLGIVYARLGRMEESEAHLMQAIELTDTIGLGFSGSVQAWCRLHLLRRGEHERALRVLEERLAQARERDAEVLVIDLASGRAFVLALLGAVESAVGILREVLDDAERQFGAVVQAKLLSGVAQCEALLGRFAAARQAAERAVHLAESAGMPLDAAHARTALAFVELREGDHTGDADAYRRGLGHAQRGLSVLMASEDSLEWVDDCDAAARLHLRLGQLDEALSKSDIVIRLLDELPVSTWLEQCLFTRYQVLQRLDRQAEASDYLRRALDRVRQVAAQTQDESLRRSWLESVPVNRDIVAEWSAQHRDPVTR